MNTIDIMRNQELLVTINPDDASIQRKVVMGDNIVSLQFQDSRVLPFAVNDWCEAFGEKYYLLEKPKRTKLEKYRYEYILTMVAEGHLLTRAQYLFLGADNSLRESDFTLMGTAETFVDLLIANANRVGGGWQKGQVIDTPFKNLSFSKEDCRAVLSRLAEEFATEFWIVGKTIHLTKMQADTGQKVQLGRNKGLYEISEEPQDNSKIVTRLYAFGAEKNLPANYRNYSPRLRMTGGEYFIEKNTDKYGIIEQTEIFDDIFPQREGKISSVNAASPYVFIDSSIDFNVNDFLLPGLSAKIVFNTGQLAGYQFEVSRFDNAIKEFTILQNKDEKVMELPSATIKPAIGDKYVIVDINMPPSYIAAAETTLKAKAQERLDLLSETQLKYRITFDPVYLRTKGYVPKIGDMVFLSDSDLQVSRKIRIISTSRYIVDEYKVDVELSDALPEGTFSRIQFNSRANGRNISGITRQLQNNALLNNNAIGGLNVKQGTITFDDIPQTSSSTGFAEILIDLATGKLYRKS